MSIRTMSYLACDLCLEIAEGSDADNARAVRKLMENSSWIRVNGEDVCPKCQRDSTRRVYPLLPTATELPRCPECVAGKHDNCDGTAWDNDADRLVACGCSHGASS